MSGFVGILGGSESAHELASFGAEPTWHDGTVAFASAPDWTDSTGTVVASGEVILDNAEELRRKLESPGSEDGQLLAELYLRYGENTGRHALGMFSVAICDSRANQLVLLRDGVGARTMYYATDGRRWWFGSRLRAVRALARVPKDISLTALRNYLTFAFVPGSETMWQSISELRPGVALRIPSGELRPYWEPEERVPYPLDSIDGHALRLRPLLEESVRVRLPNSGPVGIYLSGGLDSSLVTALAARDAPGPIHTYAINFGSKYPNELPFSQMVAEHCGTHHHVLTVTEKQIQEAFWETTGELDDPIGDPLTVPNCLLGKIASQDTQIILNGEGGDPCFGGPKNLPMLLNELYGPEGGQSAAYLRSYQKCFDDLPRLLNGDIRSALEQLPPQEEILAPFLTNRQMPQYLNRLMHINVRLKGADHILTKVSNLTSANGLIGRSPLFDRRIVEAGFQIPPVHKLAGTTEKAVLKRAVADLLPEPILTRPKSGMLVPVQAWFKHGLRRFARQTLLDRKARIRPYIDQGVVKEWLQYRGNLWPRHGVKIWLVLALEVWLRIHE